MTGGFAEFSLDQSKDSVDMVGVELMDSGGTTKSPLPVARANALNRTALMISIDGLRPAAIRELGQDGAPALHRLIEQGASTLNGRSIVEETLTLPNHASMITGRPAARRLMGHGIDINTDPGGTVHDRAGERVSSVFAVAARHGGRPALFASKEKFALFQRSWRRAIDRYKFLDDNGDLTTAVRRDLVSTNRSVRFLHLSAPDVAGHRYGFNSTSYLGAVRYVDFLLGRIIQQVKAHPRLRARLTLIVTSDHGGAALGHSDAAAQSNYTVPFITWGAGVAPGTNLYRLNPERRAGGHSQVGYRGRQPIRNGDLANLTLDILGLPAVPESRFNRRQGLDLR